MAIKISGNTVINDSREVIVPDRIIHDGDSDTRIVFGTNAISFDTGGTERSRINSTGDLLVGKSVRAPASNGVEFRYNDVTIFTRENGTAAQFRRTGAATTQQLVLFYGDSDGGTAVGAISVSATNTTYGTSSDYRLKENVASINDGLEAINLLNPVYFNFKKNPHNIQAGFIAHEMGNVIPTAVQGEKDGVDEEGNPVYQSVDASYVVPYLVASIQELSDRLNQAEAEIETLKSLG